jgi:hypothetical protein
VAHVAQLEMEIPKTHCCETSLKRMDSDSVATPGVRLKQSLRCQYLLLRRRKKGCRRSSCPAQAEGSSNTNNIQLAYKRYVLSKSNGLDDTRHAERVEQSPIPVTRIGMGVGR